jgi:hypothetical protein
MAIKQEVNAPLIVTIGTVSALLLLVIMFGTQAWFVREEQAELDKKWETSPNVQLETLRAEQREHINTTGIGGPDKKSRTMPIADAMLIIQQNNGSLPATRPSAK